MNGQLDATPVTPPIDLPIPDPPIACDARLPRPARAAAPLRILQANKFLYTKGGSESHMLTLGDWLARAGHRVRYFGMASAGHEIAGPCAGVLPEIDYRRLDGWAGKLRALRDSIYSPRVYRAVLRAVRAERPDVAHMHNVYHQLGPALAVALKRCGLPTVMTAHDYNLVCPTYLLTSPEGYCFRCRSHHYWEVLRTGCAPHGRAAAVAHMVEAFVHLFTRIWQRHLDVIISPSEFLRDRLVEGGWSPGKIRLMRNPIELDGLEPVYGPGDYLLFVGRVSREKGLDTLLEAIAAVPHVPLWIAGDGPMRDELHRLTSAGRIQNVCFLGRVPHERVLGLAQASRALVLPSRFAENCPVSILEAFASGKPVLATRVGGNPELIEHSGGGWLVPPDDPETLAKAMASAWDDPDGAVERGRAGRAWVEQNHDMAAYCRELETLYRELMERHGR